MDGDVDGAAPDAFQALGNEVRLGVLRTLFEREPPVSFSTLHEASRVEESSGFAYHLRQLTDRYVRQVGDDGYALTYAGREVARAVAAGTYTDSVAFELERLPDPCPFCGAGRLRATCTDNVLDVDCEACTRPVLSLPFPPGGLRDRDPRAVLPAFDAHHRHRLSLLREGVCPECAGTVTGRVEPVERPAGDGDLDDRDGEDGDADGEERESEGADAVQARFACDACGYEARSPVALTLLTHPAVVGLFHDHGIDPRERPIWNVGEEFRETVVSRDPLAVVVSVRVGTDLLELFVDGRAEVVDYRTGTVDAGDDDDDPTATGPVETDDPAAGDPTASDDAGTRDRESETVTASEESGTATASEESDAEPA